MTYSHHEMSIAHYSGGFLLPIDSCKHMPLVNRVLVGSTLAKLDCVVSPRRELPAPKGAGFVSLFKPQGLLT